MAGWGGWGVSVDWDGRWDSLEEKTESGGREQTTERKKERADEAVLLYHDVNFPEVTAACKLKRAGLSLSLSVYFFSPYNTFEPGAAEKDKRKRKRKEPNLNFKRWKISPC